PETLVPTDARNPSRPRTRWHSMCEGPGANTPSAPRASKANKRRGTGSTWECNQPGTLSMPPNSPPRILEGFYEMSSIWTWWEFRSPTQQANSLPPATNFEENHAPAVRRLPPIARPNRPVQVCRHQGGSITNRLIQSRRIEGPDDGVLPHGGATAVGNKNL